MQVSYTIQPEDLDALASQAHSSARKRFIPALLLMFVFVLIVAASLVFSRFLPAPQPHRVVQPVAQGRNVLSGVVGMLLPLIFIVGFWIFIMRAGKAERAKLLATPEFVQPRTTEITLEYLRHQTASGEFKTRWSGIQKVVESATHIVLWVSQTEAHVVPKRAFANHEDATQFAQTATKYWQQAHS